MKWAAPDLVNTSPSKRRHQSTFLFITAEYNLLQIKRARCVLMQDKHSYLKRGVDDQRDRSGFATAGMERGELREDEFQHHHAFALHHDNDIHVRGANVARCQPGRRVPCVNGITTPDMVVVDDAGDVLR